jgi:WD40 repeat protein
VAISNDQRLMASGSDDRLVILFDFETKNDLKNLEGHEGAVMKVIFA